MKYELTLTVHKEDGKLDFHKIEMENLIHLLSQFTMLLLNIQRKEHEEELSALRMENDDIPF